MAPDLRMTELTKTYGKIVALNGLSLSVEAGTVYGLIGPNGAGKTTTMAILAGLRKASSGRAQVLGIDVRPNCRELVSRIGFSSPQYPFFDYLTGYEILTAFALLHGLRPGDAEGRAHDLLELLDLVEAAGHYVYEYSRGMRQKLGLACAMIHAPQVYLLDEPFDGLDAATAYRLRHTLRQLAAKGKTILLASHDLAGMELVCDRVGVIHEGKLKHEAVLAGAPALLASAGEEDPAFRRPLEDLLWKVVGTPVAKDLSWV